LKNAVFIDFLWAFELWVSKKLKNEGEDEEDKDFFWGDDKGRC
jgi:hypothetical protein